MHLRAYLLILLFFPLAISAEDQPTRVALFDGDGRVFCFSPHPELREALNHLIPLVTRWAAGKD